ncbi:MAG: hypothetical protein V3T83_14345, partial [Acidobacteriota bacterium]
LLIIHHQRLGIPAGIVSPSSLEQDGRTSLQVSGDLLKNLRKNCDRMLQSVRRESGEGRLRARISRLLRRRPAPWQSVHRFREDLENASRQAHRLLQNDVSQERFNRFGHDLCTSLKRFRLSPSYRDLRQRSSHLRRMEQIGLQFQVPHNDLMVARNCKEAGRRMLDFLSLIRYADSLLHPEGDGRQIILLLVFGYYRCRRLFVQLDDLKRFLPESHALAEFLSWSVSGLKMEASRAFRNDLRHLDSDYEKDVTIFYERVGHALGILQNAFEQTSCGFFQILDPHFQLQHVSGNPEEKCEEALQLLQGLKQIQQLARSLQESGTPQGQASFYEALHKFRNESFTALFRRDRIPFAEFECQLRRVQGSSALGSALHHFQVFLSVLQAQIRNRGVLCAVQPSVNGCSMQEHEEQPHQAVQPQSLLRV